MNLCSERSWHSSVDGVVGQGASLNLAVLSAGTHTVTASVEDSSGNSASARPQLMIENQAPLLTLISPPTYFNYVEIGDPVTLRASAVDVVDGDILSQILWSSGDVNPADGWDVTVTLSPGVHYVQAFIENSLGLYSSQRVQVVVEHRPPMVTMIEPSSTTYVSQGTSVSFSGTAVAVLGGDLTAQLRWVSTLDRLLHVGAGFSASTLSVGRHDVYAEAIDSHNALGEDFVLFVVESLTLNSPPAVNAYPSTWEPITASATDSQGAKGGSELNVTVVQSSLLQSSVARSDVSSGQQPFEPDRLPRKRDWLVRSINERQGVRPTFVQPSFIGAVL